MPPTDKQQYQGQEIEKIKERSRNKKCPGVFVSEAVLLPFDRLWPRICYEHFIQVGVYYKQAVSLLVGNHKVIRLLGTQTAEFTLKLSGY